MLLIGMIVLGGFAANILFFGLLILLMWIEGKFPLDDDEEGRPWYGIKVACGKESRSGIVRTLGGRRRVASSPPSGSCILAPPVLPAVP